MELIEKMQIIGNINYKLDTIISIIDNFNSNLISQIPTRQEEIHKLTKEVKDLISEVSKELFNSKLEFMRVIIYSNEHKAFWKANYMGYTNNYKEAGIYNADKVQKDYPKIKFDTNNDDFMIPCESISFVKTMLNKWIKDLSVSGSNTKAIVRAEMEALLEELNK